MKKDNWKKEEIAEDYCFICKDGGHLRSCNFKNCLKAYHPQCVGKDHSFLESDEHWTCGWHSCLICQKSSTFQCFCCPCSICRACIKAAEFVQVKRKTKGFCNNCLRLTIMIEEDKDVNYNGDKVDFKDTNTYEFLFKDYWEIVKDQEGLTLVDLHAADALFKRGENYQDGPDSDKEKLMSKDGQEDNCDEVALFKDIKGMNRMKSPKKKSRSKKRSFIGWGSVELIGFLTSIGKDTEKPLTQVDVCEIIKDYCQIKNLYHPDKKKKKRQIVVCDEMLHSLFRKRKLKPYKIFDLLETHFAESFEFDNELSFSSEEDEGVTFRKKQRRSETKIQKSEPRISVLEPPKSCYAAIVSNNVKLVYLKRSLILSLLQNPETFENKVIGSFVRVKNDPKEFYYQPQHIYKLGQVTGIKKAPQAYKLGETSTDIVLCISNLCKDIYISMLSDDDFEEEELEDLHQLVKAGLFKRPTVAELDRKMRIVHEDIMNHWIDKEILKLQKQIERANEKGWRRELHEYIERREQFRSPEERMRLVKEIPEIIADMEVEIKATASALLTSNKENKAPSGASYLEKVAEWKPEGNGAAYVANAAEGKSEGNDTASYEVTAERREFEDSSAVPGPLIMGDGADSYEKVVERKRKYEVNEAVAGENGDASHEKVAERIHEGHEARTSENIVEDVAGGISAASTVQKLLNLGGEQQSKCSNIQVIEIKEDKEVPREKRSSVVQIIDLEEDEEDLPNASKDDDRATVDACEEIVQAATPETHKAVWHYIDPSGNEHGPFPLTSLRFWSEEGFFDDDFKVWRTGQSRDDAILLTSALTLAFS